MRIALVIALVACARPAPPPRVVPPAAVAEAPSAQPAAMTCGEVGVILRGSVEDPQHAGPAKEAAIARACLHGKWPAEVISCVGTKGTASRCLADLTTEQRKGYAKLLVKWNEVYPDEVFDDYGVDDDDPVLTCADGVGDASSYNPKIGGIGDDRDFAVSARTHALQQLCMTGAWDVSVIECLQDTDVETCRQLLAPDQQKALTDRLAELDKLAGKLAATKTKPPATFDCKRVVAAYYGDGAWKGKADTMKGAERKKMIAESRAKMTKACGDEKWSANLRACLVASGGDVCFIASGQVALRWGFPAGGVIVKTGIAECDAYGAAIVALSQCPTFPPTAAEHMLQAYSQGAAAWASIPADQKPMIAQACKAGEAAIRQSASSLGCTI